MTLLVVPWFCYISLYISVLHDFFTQLGKTKIFVTKKHEGYGLVCHRAVKACCEAIGIKDMHAKVEGAKNLQHIIKAFFIGLLQQVCSIPSDTIQKEWGDNI